MLRNKQEHISTSRKQKKSKEKSNAHRAASMIDSLSSEINERSKTDEWSLNSDGIEVKLV